MARRAKHHIIQDAPYESWLVATVDYAAKCVVCGEPILRDGPRIIKRRGGRYRHSACGGDPVPTKPMEATNYSMDAQDEEATRQAARDDSAPASQQFARGRVIKKGDGL